MPVHPLVVFLTRRLGQQRGQPRAVGGTGRCEHLRPQCLPDPLPGVLDEGLHLADRAAEDGGEIGDLDAVAGVQLQRVAFDRGNRLGSLPGQ